ncbi:hypothetical protein D0Z67_01285 [Streptomyces seoulensis]|uniref:Uncharacterized protein n=1 Tax=Streptomyces seoulensis TaxID=73044 RepID=A0A4P6TRF1_STRSO|nr:hypothetical protein [Streptomyces seoulensis]QBJ89084.1 hypothetical protein D0Z67_01285 [Streptomyces seoulensis]
MTTQGLGSRLHRRLHSGQDRVNGAVARTALLAVTTLVAAAAGVAGTLVYQKCTVPDTSSVDAQAAELAGDLRGDLNAGLYSGGSSYGGQFTEGTLVAQVEAHGGVLLSASTKRNQASGIVHTADVMLGLVPPGTEPVVADAYPVNCYRYTFGVGMYSVKRSGITCPSSRTDGRPGSLTAQMGALLTRRPTGIFAYRQVASKGYAHTPQGAVEFLKEQHLVTARDVVNSVVGTADGDGVYVLALSINDACHYLRMDSSPTASRLIPLWAAPADSQSVCGVRQAVAAAGLYGIDPAKQR